MPAWREWGLTPEEWRDCVEAAEELRMLSDGHERTATAEEIAAQLAIAKAASALPGEGVRFGSLHLRDPEPHRRLVPRGRD